MISEIVNSKFKQLPKLYKLTINKNLINYLFYFCWTLIVVGVIIMICGISISSLTKNQQLAIGISGISISFLFLIVYYLFEYIRRKTLLKLNELFGFINLYQKPLYDQKIITDQIVNLNALKNDFCVMHAKYTAMISPNIYLMKKYGIYELQNKNQGIIFSYFETDELGYKKKINYHQQIIFKTNIKTNNTKLFITKKDRFQIGYQGYSNKTTIKDFDIFYNDKNELALATKLINNKLIKIKELDVDIQINDDTLLIFTIKPITYLLLDVSYFKFYKFNYELLYEHVDKDYENFKLLLDFVYKIKSILDTKSTSNSKNKKN